MPENEPLLKAVLDSPDDDAPRLRYAEWCEQQPDLATKDRARFIRAQIALSKLAVPDQTYELRSTSEKLNRVHAAVWALPLVALVDRYQFDRGFVELVGLSAKHFLENAPQLFKRAPIRHLVLSAVLPSFPDLLRSEHLKGLRSLQLDRCELGDNEIAALANCENASELRWLSVTYNQIGENGVAALARSRCLKKLCYVCLAGNPIEPNEQYSYDNGFVVESSLPPDGVRLEARLGHLRWLHHAAITLEDSIPSRFRVAP